MHLQLPAEWSPQAAVMLTWPHADTDWAEQLTEVEQVYVNLARAICAYELLLVACHDEQVRQRVATQLAQADIPASQYQLYLAPCNDTWARDHGPLCIYANGQRQLLDFQFNAWGNKYSANLDNFITRQLHQAGAFASSPLHTLAFVLEGGSIESDGQGTLLTTRNCLLSPERNSALNQAQIEHFLRQHLGVERILWLQAGNLSGDDTDSHIDTLARFCDTHSIAYVACDDEKDEHFAPLQAMEAELKSFRQANGEPYRLFALPLPAPKFNAEGQRLPATYANFLILNTVQGATQRRAVLMPTYRDAADALALQTLATAFPGHAIIGVDCLPLIHQFGSLHCVTMQIPREQP